MYLDLEKRTNKKTGKVSRTIWSKERIENNWLKYINKRPALAKAWDKLKDNYEKNNVIHTFWRLQFAFLKGGRVYLECTKYPSGGLDKGRHYYTLHYDFIAEKKIVADVVWFHEPLAKEFGYWKRYDSGFSRAFNFGSGVIGMSRALDATDYFMNICKEVIGIYAQLDVM